MDTAVQIQPEQGQCEEGGVGVPEKMAQGQASGKEKGALSCDRQGQVSWPGCTGVTEKARQRLIYPGSLEKQSPRGDLLRTRAPGETSCSQAGSHRVLDADQRTEEEHRMGMRCGRRGPILLYRLRAGAVWRPGAAGSQSQGQEAED